MPRHCRSLQVQEEKQQGLSHDDQAEGLGKKAAEDRRHARRERLFLPPTALFNHIAAHSYGFAREGTCMGVGTEGRPLSDVPSNVFPLSTHLLVGGMEWAPGGRTS